MNVSGIVQVFAGASWVIVIGAISLLIVQISRNKNTKPAMLILLVGVLLAVVLSSTSAGLVFIQPEERGVVISALAPEGYRAQPLQPGLRWIIPYFETVVTYPISKQTYTMSIASNEGQKAGDDSITARTADGQEVFIDASIIYAINPAQVTQIHIQWQNRYSEDLIRPLVRGAIRDAVSQFKVEEVYSTRRGELSQMIFNNMADKMTANGLSLVDFVLRNITFSSEYAASVEQKQIAEQQAQQAKFVVEQRKQEAQQAIETAKGEAESVKIKADGDAQARLIQADAEAKALKMIADAIKDNPDLLTYQYISKLAPGIQVMLVPNTTPYLLPLPSMPGTTAPQTTTPTPY